MSPSPGRVVGHPSSPSARGLYTKGLIGAKKASFGNVRAFVDWGWPYWEGFWRFLKLVLSAPFDSRRRLMHWISSSISPTHKSVDDGWILSIAVRPCPSGMVLRQSCLLSLHNMEHSAASTLSACPRGVTTLFNRSKMGDSVSEGSKVSVGVGPPCSSDNWSAASFTFVKARHMVCAAVPSLICYCVSQSSRSSPPPPPLIPILQWKYCVAGLCNKSRGPVMSCLERSDLAGLHRPPPILALESARMEPKLQCLWGRLPV